MPRLKSETANAGYRDNIYQRGNRWYVRFMVDGKETRESAGRSKAAAQLLLVKRREDAERGRMGMSKKNIVTLAEFAPRYLAWAKAHKRSWERDERSLRTLVQHLGTLRLNAIEREVVEGYQRDRCAEEIKRIRKGTTAEGASTKKDARHVQGPTVNREIACLRKLLSRAVDEKQIEVNPLFGVKDLMLPESPARQPNLSYADEERLLDACSPSWVRLAVRLAIATGCRQGELLALKWRHVDFDSGELIVEDSKSGRSRRVPVNDIVLSELKQLQRQRERAGTDAPEDGAVVHELSKRRQIPEAFVILDKDNATPTGNALVQAFNRARKAIERPDLRFHDCRHVCGSRLLEAGANLPEVAAVLGHTTLVMANRYAHASRPRLRTLVNAVPVTGQTNGQAGEQGKA